MSDTGMWWITQIKETPGVDGVELSLCASIPPLEEMKDGVSMRTARVRLTGPDLRALHAAMRKAMGADPMSGVDERQPGTVEAGPAGCPRPDLVCDRHMQVVSGAFEWSCAVCGDLWRLQDGKWRQRDHISERAT